MSIEQVFRIQSTLKSKFSLQTAQYGNFDYMTVIQTRLKNIFENTGIILIKTLMVDDTGNQYRFQYRPTSMQNMLNQLNAMVSYEGNAMNTLGTWSTDGTRLIFQSDNEYVITANGNTRLLTGIVDSGHPIDAFIYTWTPMTLDIEYLTIRCPQVQAQFQGTDQFDRGTIAVISRANQMNYFDKNLSVQMPCLGSVFDFYIEDQNNRRFSTDCYLELILRTFDQDDDE